MSDITANGLTIKPAGGQGLRAMEKIMEPKRQGGEG